MKKNQRINDEIDPMESIGLRPSDVDDPGATRKLNLSLPSAVEESTEAPPSEQFHSLFASMNLSVGSKKEIAGERTAFLRYCGLEYELGDSIGKGGQAEVLGAEQVVLGREVALKIARGDRSSRLFFFKEAFTSAQLDHPNIVPVYDMGMLDSEDGRVPALAMKKIVGNSWNVSMKSDREEMGGEEFLAKHLPILSHVINAISYAHSKFIIHRDLKPTQVMIGEFGEVYLLDWGLAVLLDDRLQSEKKTPVYTNRFFTLKSATNPAGTPAYMAPEQAGTETGNLGIHTDIYLLGAILYELLTGKAPHMAHSGREAFARAAANDYDPIPPTAPFELAHITRRCLDADPNNRPSKAIELRIAIESYLAGSGRKSESRSITEKIVERRDWGTLNEISSEAQRIAQAAHLWPGNPQIEEARNTVLAAFVHKALESGDFLLARLQAERIRDVKKSEALSAHIEEEAERAALALPHSPILSDKRISVVIAINLLIFGAFLFAIMAGQNAVHREIGDSVKSIVTLAAEEVPADALRSVDRDRDMASPDFQETLKYLNFIRRSDPDIRNVYTIRPNTDVGNNAWMTLVDANPTDSDLDNDGELDPDEAGAPPGHIQESEFEPLWKALEEETTTSGFRSTETGDYISGFAPVIDDVTGKPVAIVGVDIALVTVEKKLGRFLLVSSLAALVLMSLTTCSLVAFFYSRRTLERSRRLREETQKQNSALLRRDIYLG